MHGFERSAIRGWFSFRWAFGGAVLGILIALFAWAASYTWPPGLVSDKTVQFLSSKQVYETTASWSPSVEGSDNENEIWRALHRECRSFGATDATMINLAFLYFKEGDTINGMQVAEAAHRVEDRPKSFVLHHIVHHFIWDEHPDVGIALQVANLIDDDLTKARALTDVAAYQAATKDDGWKTTTEAAVLAAKKSAENVKDDPPKRKTSYEASGNTPYVIALWWSALGFVGGGVAKPILEAIGKALLAVIVARLPAVSIKVNGSENGQSEPSAVRHAHAR